MKIGINTLTSKSLKPKYYLINNERKINNTESRRYRCPNKQQNLNDFCMATRTNAKI